MLHSPRNLPEALISRVTPAPKASSSSCSVPFKSKSPNAAFISAAHPDSTRGNMNFSGPGPCQHLAPGWVYSGSSVHVERWHVKGNYFFSISFSLKLVVDVRLFGAVCCFSWFLHFPLFFMEHVALISCKALQINIKVRGWKPCWSSRGTFWFHWTKKCFQPQRAEVFQNKTVLLRACASSISAGPRLLAF